MRQRMPHRPLLTYSHHHHHLPPRKLARQRGVPVALAPTAPVAKQCRARALLSGTWAAVERVWEDSMPFCDFSACLPGPVPMNVMLVKDRVPLAHGRGVHCVVTYLDVILDHAGDGQPAA